jgi:hypothetical protein
MSRRTAAALLLAMTTGCQATGQASLAEPLIVHLTTEACILEGSAVIFTGVAMRVHAVNDSDNVFDLRLVEPSGGHTSDEIAAHYAEMQGPFESGQPVPTPLAWLTEAAHLEVPAGQEADLEQPLGPGSYTILCQQVRADESFPVNVLGPMDVTGS